MKINIIKLIQINKKNIFIYKSIIKIRNEQFFDSFTSTLVNQFFFH